MFADEMTEVIDQWAGFVNVHDMGGVLFNHSILLGTRTAKFAYTGNRFINWKFLMHCVVDNCQHWALISEVRLLFFID